MWSIPNGAIVRVGNQSKVWSKAVLDVSIWYAADVDEAVALMQRVAAEVCALPEFESVVLDPPTVLGVERLTADGVVLRVVVRTAPGARVELMRCFVRHSRPRSRHLGCRCIDREIEKGWELATL